MPNWMRIWTVILFAAGAFPLEAQEWIYCPANPQELDRQCQQAGKTIQTNQTLIATLGDQIQNPDIILAKVDRKPGESVLLYKSRVKQQQGVATPTTNRWLPIIGRYFDADQQIMYVALDRQSYWQYVWEKLAPDEAFARRTFNARQNMSRQFKLKHFTGPTGQLTQWQQEIASLRLFRQQCCPEQPDPSITTVEPLPGSSPAP